MSSGKQCARWKAATWASRNNIAWEMASFLACYIQARRGEMFPSPFDNPRWYGVMSCRDDSISNLRGVKYLSLTYYHDEMRMLFGSPWWVPVRRALYRTFQSAVRRDRINLTLRSLPFDWTWLNHGRQVITAYHAQTKSQIVSCAAPVAEQSTTSFVTARAHICATTPHRYCISTRT